MGCVFEEGDLRGGRHCSCDKAVSGASRVAVRKLCDRYLTPPHGQVTNASTDSFRPGALQEAPEWMSGGNVFARRRVGEMEKRLTTPEELAGLARRSQPQMR